MISKDNHATSRDSCCLPSVKKQKHDFRVFAFVQCIIKQLLDSVFVISRIIKFEVRVICRSRRLRLITLTEISQKLQSIIVYNLLSVRSDYQGKVSFGTGPTEKPQMSRIMVSMRLFLQRPSEANFTERTEFFK